MTWVDLESAKEKQHRKEVGFCIGGGWNHLSAEEAEKILRGQTDTSLANQPPHSHSLDYTSLVASFVFVKSKLAFMIRNVLNE